MLLMTNNYKFISKKKDMSIDCVMMTSSLFHTCSIETYSYIVQVLGLITLEFGIWYLMTIFVDGLPHYIKNTKK